MLEQILVDFGVAFMLTQTADKSLAACGPGQLKTSSTGCGLWSVDLMQVRIPNRRHTIFQTK
jgi:hypothetical protein